MTGDKVFVILSAIIECLLIGAAYAPAWVNWLLIIYLVPTAYGLGRIMDPIELARKETYQDDHLSG